MLAAERIFDPKRALVEAAQPEWAEVDVPFAIIDLDEAMGLRPRLGAACLDS